MIKIINYQKEGMEMKEKEPKRTLSIDKTGVFEGSLREVAQWIIHYGLKEAWFVQVGKTGVLFCFVLRSDSRILDNETYVIEECITDVIFTRIGVDGYKPTIIYNHKQKTCQYIDQEKEDKSNPVPNTFEIDVFCVRDKVTEKIKKTLAKIIKKGDEK